MGVQRTTFEKLQRERNKKAKAAAKRARREEKGSGEESDLIDLPTLEDEDDDGLGALSAGELLQRVEQIHQRFEAKLISFEEFEEAKEQLLARITVD